MIYPMHSYKAVRTSKDVHQQRDEIMALAWQYRARQVFVFGSLMRGGLQSASDIDFLVEFEEGYKLRDHIRLTQGLQRLLGRRVEVVDRRNLREERRATILEEAQLV